MTTLSSGSAPGSAVTSPFRAPTRLPRSNSRKSPPLAFEKTPNDALAPLISPPAQELDRMSFGDSYAIVEKQANALTALHTAFAVEREAWNVERTSLYQRVANLERLLRAQNGHSPAKSPVISPDGTVTSPQSRATSNLRLPSITEDENLRPLSERREHAPRAIAIPTIPTVAEVQSHRASLDFSYNAASQLDELGVTPPQSGKRFDSPDDESHGKTLHSSKIRPPTPPPKEMTLIGVEDTPTRHNTHINTLLTQSGDEEEDVGLTGPLNLPELPSNPTPHNFTEDMLVKRLEQIAQHPDENKPTIFSVSSPGLATAEDDGFDAGLSPKSRVAASSEGPLAPIATRDQTVRSPEADPAASNDSDHDQKFAQGGIRLKKKPSTNFGVPFGQLGGFGSLRKLS